MVYLITDSSCLYTPKEAEALGFRVNPLIVTIGGNSYHEYVEINPTEFLELINKGDFPTSSQPTIGEILESVEHHRNDEIILLCMADGLSGTYQTACAAVQELEYANNIHVVNSKTLCGPHRFLVHLILSLIKENKTATEILSIIQPKIDSSKSFLLPQDFNYLKRGGRCTPLTAKIGGLLKLQPVVQQTPDGCRLDKFITARSFDIAIKKIIATLAEQSLQNPRFSISHAFALEQATRIKEMLIKQFPHQMVEIFELSCAFITQGGPYCIAIQAIEE